MGRVFNAPAFHPDGLERGLGDVRWSRWLWFSGGDSPAFGGGRGHLTKEVLLHLSLFVFRDGLARALREFVAPVGLSLSFLLGRGAGDALPALDDDVFSVGWICWIFHTLM